MTDGDVDMAQLNPRINNPQQVTGSVGRAFLS